MGDDRKTVLFLTHLYPRYEGDSMAPFLATLIENLTPFYKMIVLCPRHEKAESSRNGVIIEYFGYCIRQWEKFSYTGNLYAKLRGLRIHYHLLTIFFMLGFFIKGIQVVFKHKPDIIHCSWFVPAGVIGYLLSILFNTPLVLTVHSDAYLVKKNRILRSVAKVLFNHAKVVIAVSNAVKEFIAPICPNVRVIYSCNRVF